MIGTELELEEELVTTTTKEHSLVVYNDDHNTFEHVIHTLINVCNHDQYQAEQCTYIIHFKGKCSVKVGEFDSLLPLKRALSEKGLSAKIH